MYIATYALAALFALLFIAFVVTLFFFMFRARKNGAPFYPTPATAIRTALKEANLKTGETFYDLGAGTGKALLIAEQEFAARAIGFEIDPIFYCIVKINLLLRHSRATLIARNFFHENIRDADVIFCFLTIRTMPTIEEKIKSELKPGARVIVYAFPLPGMAPIKTIPIHGEWNVFIYKI